MATPYAVIGVIVGEFTSSVSGLFINYASPAYDPAGVFASIFILLAIVAILNAAATRIERRLLRWLPQGNSAPPVGGN